MSPVILSEHHHTWFVIYICHNCFSIYPKPYLPYRYIILLVQTFLLQCSTVSELALFITHKFFIGSHFMPTITKTVNSYLLIESFEELSWIAGLVICFEKSVGFRDTFNHRKSWKPYMFIYHGKRNITTLTQSSIERMKLTEPFHFKYWCFHNYVLWRIDRFIGCKRTTDIDLHYTISFTLSLSLTKVLQFLGIDILSMECWHKNSTSLCFQQYSNKRLVVANCARHNLTFARTFFSLQMSESWCSKYDLHTEFVTEV